MLVTRGSKGSMLLTSDGRLYEQPAIMIASSTANTGRRSSSNKKSNKKSNEDDSGDDIRNDDDDDDDDDGVNDGGGVVVDETGAGDCYRAAFCVALMEGHDVEDCMKFASAAGSCSVQVHGAVPSAPTRSQVLDRLCDDTVLRMPRGGGGGEGRRRDDDGGGGDGGSSSSSSGSSDSGSGSGDGDDDEEENDDGRTIDESSEFPYLIGSRLNSMKDRPELWTSSSSAAAAAAAGDDGRGHPLPLETPRDFVRRQSNVKGLTCVDFNYPQHFGSYWTPAEAREALDDVGLKAGAVCLRYPSPKFARGAMNHPNIETRKEAIRLTKEAADVATVLGCNEVVIWSAFDGCKY